jgi:hypothetical protein
LIIITKIKSKLKQIEMMKESNEKIRVYGLSYEYRVEISRAFMLWQHNLASGMFEIALIYFV